MADKLIEVTFKKDCTFAGEDQKKGDKVKVTEAQAEVLKKHDLV